jgi:hypothetical protein
MPMKELKAAEEYWENIKKNVQENLISPEYFYKASDHKKFHVRPKAQKASDVTANPHGGTVKKYCYWFNKDYIKEIVEQQYK